MREMPTNKELLESGRSTERIWKPQRRAGIGLLISGSQVRALVRASNRAFVRRISGCLFLGLLSLPALGRSGDNFRRLVSAAKNSVPGGWLWGLCPFAVEAHIPGFALPQFGALDRAPTLFGIEFKRFELPAHSVGRLRSRSTPNTGGGRRPSTAALTRLGARKASEIVMLTCLTAALLASTEFRVGGHPTCNNVIKPPTTTCDSHSRRNRRSNCCGRTSLRWCCLEAGSDGLSWTAASAREL